MIGHSILGQLGFAADARVAIVHADDLGSCHAANLAFQENIAFGITTSGAVMVPCPWFPELAAYCRAHPEADVGVHLALNCEWQMYRWGPISTRDPASGLLDEEGYLPRSVAELHAHMDPDAAIAEMRAQVKRALAAGIDVTHIDTHMGAVIHPRLLPAYLQLAAEFRLPVMLPRLTEEQLAAHGVPAELATMVQKRQALLGQMRLVAPDHLRVGTSAESDTLARYRDLFRSLPPGITHLLYHPAKGGEEIEGIATNGWRPRVADYAAMLSAELKAFIAQEGIHLIGYRRLRELMRDQHSARNRG